MSTKVVLPKAQEPGFLACVICGAPAKQIVKGDKGKHPTCKNHFKQVMELKRKRRLP